MRCPRNVVVLAVVTVALVGCQACDRPPTGVASNPDVLAVYSGGVVTVDDIDREFLQLPPAQRMSSQTRSIDYIESLIRRLVVERSSLAGADIEAIEGDARFGSVHEERRQQVVARYFIQSRLGGVGETGPDEARRYFDDNREEFFQPARRLVSHIFRRVTTAADAAAVVAEMSAIRDRVIRGESFAAMARQYSDSETAQFDGELGWMEKDRLSADLADLVFDLEEGVPSHPITTEDGVHLFLVVSASPARKPSFEEVRGRIGGILDGRRRQAAVAELAAGLPQPEPFFMATKEDLEGLFATGDPGVVVLQIGAVTLDLGSLRAHVDRARPSLMGLSGTDQVIKTLDALAERARIYEHCRVEGILDEPVLSAMLDRALDHDVISYLRDRALVDLARRDSHKLEAYYAAHRSRYSSPLLVDLEVLTVPIPDDGAGELMALLSTLDSSLGEDALGDIATRIGGQVEISEGVSLSQLMKVNPKAASLTSVLEVGSFSTPFRVDQSINLIRVTDRVEPKPRAYAAVADAVVRDYVGDHRQELYLEWSNRVLEDVGLKVIDEHLQMLVAGGSGAASVPETS